MQTAIPESSHLPFFSLPPEMRDRVAELLPSRDRTVLAQLMTSPDLDELEVGKLSYLNIERDLSPEDITPCFKRRASYVRHLTLYPLAERQITYSGYLEAIPVYGDGVAMRRGSPLCVSWKDFVVFTSVIQGMDLFKNLQSLVVAHEGSFPDADRFLTPFLNKDLKAMVITCRVPGLWQAAQSLQLRLTKLEIYGSGPSLVKGTDGSGAFDDDLLRALGLWIPSLSSLCITSNNVKQLLPFVRRGRSLQHLKLDTIFYSNPLNPPSDPSQVPNLALQSIGQHQLYALRSLSVGLHTTSLALSLLGSPVLEDVELTRHQAQGADDVIQLLENFAQLHSLRRICIGLAHHSKLRHPRLCDLRLAHLAPLFSLKLERLAIYEVDNVQLSDSDCETLAKSLPTLRSCAIVANAGLMEGSTPACTLRALGSFAVHCPSLEELEIQLTATDVPRISSGNSFTGNTCLRKLGLDQVPHGPVWDPRGVAEFVHALFPYIDGVQPCSASTEPHEYWGPVNERLSELS
ncbi:hypothetical protein K523DRAFT_401713 [Schizophyllum commune Tattone D]|nr:hypothetical protein K523DRAFT_401713 [Schizophyllum commune Tattone D]